MAQSGQQISKIIKNRQEIKELANDSTLQLSKIFLMQTGYFGIVDNAVYFLHQQARANHFRSYYLRKSISIFNEFIERGHVFKIKNIFDASINWLKNCQSRFQIN